VILKYNYWYFLSAIPPSICDQIIEAGLSSMYEQEEKYGKEVSNAAVGGWRQKTDDARIPIKAASVSGLHKKGIDAEKTYIRDSSVAWLNDPAIYKIIWDFVNQANTSAGWNFNWDYTEDLQFTKYSPGQFYGWHTDVGAEPYRAYDPAIDTYHKNSDGSLILDTFGNPLVENQSATENKNLVGKIRKLSVTVSLNDPSEYKGGNLKFDLGPHSKKRYHTCTEIRPRGSIIVFPSHLYHQVTPVTTGTRYSLVAWNLGKPFQ
jgi:PKHD-type hydroxylase